VAAYGQQTWRPLKWLSLNGGARVDEDLRPDDDQHYGQVSPRGVVAINPWHNGTLKVIYSQAFRAPSYFETNFTDNQTIIPNVKLQPETVQSGEVSFEQRFGTQRVFVGGFDAIYSNMVLLEDAPTNALVSAVNSGVLRPKPTPDTRQNVINNFGPNGSIAVTEQNQNLSGIDDIGINAAFEGTALNRDLRYGANFTWAYARQTGPNPSPTTPGPCPGSPPNSMAEANCTLPLTVTPQAFGNARVSYDIPGDWPIVGVAVSVIGRRPVAGAFDSSWTPIPYAPTQVDLRGTISGRFPWLPSLSYRFIVDYAIAALNPYLVGPVSSPTTTNPTPELIPVDQLRTTIGLQYDLK
jgi:outer membrane receptor for ferrienterochelin and colicins